jgi:hypothetical protein
LKFRNGLGAGSILYPNEIGDKLVSKEGLYSIFSLLAGAISAALFIIVDACCGLEERRSA